MEEQNQHQLLMALKHPLRRDILRVMVERKTASPVQISEALRAPLSNVSYHVRVLACCEAVALARTQPVRGSVEHFYRVDIDEPWALAALGVGGDG